MYLNRCGLGRSANICAPPYLLHYLPKRFAYTPFSLLEEEWKHYSKLWIYQLSHDCLKTFFRERFTSTFTNHENQLSHPYREDGRDPLLAGAVNCFLASTVRATRRAAARVFSNNVAMV